MRDCNVAKRRKTWHSKSKGGYKTCKLRRVKCDEQQPQCRRCIATDRRCEGYAENVQPWLFESSKTQSSSGREEMVATSPPEEDASVLDLSPFNRILTSPYNTHEAQAALQFWLRLTKPDATDCPISNELHATLGEYIPQAAWHLAPVRYSLLSVASTALVLEARASNLGVELQASMSKQSVIQMHLAIRAMLEERQASLSAAITAMMLGIACVWTGRWEEALRNMRFCVNLAHEVRAKGEHVKGDLFIAAEATIQIAELLPSPSSMATERARTRYAYRVFIAAKLWTEDAISQLEKTNANAMLKIVLSNYLIRMKWILNQWREFGPEDNHFNAIHIEKTGFAPAVRQCQSLLLEDEGSCGNFDLRLLTTRLILAMKISAFYGGGGSAQRLRDAATACHARLSTLACCE